MSRSGRAVGTAVNIGQLLDALDRASARAQDVRPFFQEVVERDTTALLLAQFSTEGEALGSRWAPLAPSTLAQKARHGADSHILQDTREMMNAVTNPRHPDAIAIVQRLRYIRSVQGRAKSIAEFHRTGTSRMPARPVLGDGIPRPTVMMWSSQLLAWVKDGSFPA